MMQLYKCLSRSVRAQRAALAAVLLTCAAGTAHAQLGYSAGNAQNVTTAYTDLGTTGTAIATANNDDANSAATPLGFAFTFNGTAFTDFVLNTNGFLKLGAAAPTGPQFTDGGQSLANGPLDGPDTNLLLPFNQDLGPGAAGTEYRVLTAGTAPNRICTIQWKNVSDKPRTTFATQYANFSFQVKLYETSNQIEFVYGTATGGAPAADVAKLCNVGIKGTSAAESVLALKISGTLWSGTTFLTGPYTLNAHNVRGTVLPDPGRAYRFTTPVANDAAPAAIQGYGSMVVPAGNPFSMRGVVRNAGSTALGPVQVTLTISGANTYSQTQPAPALALNGSAVVDFPGILLPNAGPNTVTISVPADGNNNNNSFSQTMETSATTFSYIAPGIPQTSSYGFTPSTGFTSAFCAKFTLSTARSVTAVRAVIGNDAGLVPNAANNQRVTTVFGVVVDATSGALLARSPDFALAAADLGQLRTFTLSVPATLPAGDFLVGLAQVVPAGTVADAVFPMAYQAEVPARPGLFFSASISATGPPNDNTVNNARYMLEAVTGAPANNDIAVSEIQGYGAIAVPNGNPVTLRAVVRNGGLNATAAPLVVTLNITGANTATQTQTVPALAAGATAVVTFTGLNLGSVGANTVTVTVPADDNNANNSLAQALATSATRFSFVLPGVPSSGSYGMGTTATAASTRALCAKFTVKSLSDVTAVRAFIAADPALVTQSTTVFGVVLNATTGALIARSPDYVLTTPDLGRLYTFNLVGRVPAGDFLVGMAQVLRPGVAAQFPLGIQSETPSRTSLFNAVNITAGTAPVTLAASGGPAAATVRLMLEAETSVVLATSAALRRAVSVFPNPSASGVFTVEVQGANARQGLGVEVTSMLGQRVYTGTAKDDFRTAVDLSSLAPGIYTLVLRNGQEYTQQKISIVR